LCGTGNPLPDRNRADACTAVFAGGNFYLVDVGPGAWKNLALWHIPAPPLAAVMLTHFHSDQIGELGEVNMQTWAQGRDHPLRVFGPPGVEQVVGGFEQAYALRGLPHRTSRHRVDAGRELAGCWRCRENRYSTSASPCRRRFCDRCWKRTDSSHRIHC